MSSSRLDHASYRGAIRNTQLADCSLESSKTLWQMNKRVIHVVTRLRLNPQLKRARQSKASVAVALRAEYAIADANASSGPIRRGKSWLMRQS